MTTRGVQLHAFILAGLVAAATPAVAQSGPVGYWKGDSSTAVIDSSGNNPNGTYQGSATTSTTNKPTLQFTNVSSMSFNGTTAYAVVPTVSWQTGGPVTVAFWNRVTTAVNSTAWSVGNLDSPSRFMSHAPWSDGNIYWDYGDIGTTGRISTSYTAYLGAWTHVALVSAGNGGNFKAIYLNGVLVVSATVSDGPDSPLSGLEIGRKAGSYHPGLIDDFRIYNRVLTLAQIQALAAGATEPDAPLNLMATAGPGFGEISLTWAASANATSYNLKRGSQPGGPYNTIIPVVGTSTTDSGLLDNRAYYYVVSAIGTLGESPNSTEDFAVTLIPPPPPPRTQELGNESGRCGCGSISPGMGAWMGALLALASLLAFARRH